MSRNGKKSPQSSTVHPTLEEDSSKKKIGVEVNIPIQVADFQYVKIGAWYETQIKPGEKTSQAYKRAWKVVEREAERKRQEYLDELGK